MTARQCGPAAGRPGPERRLSRRTSWGWPPTSTSAALPRQGYQVVSHPLAGDRRVGRAAAGARAPLVPARLVAAVRGPPRLPLQPRRLRRPRHRSASTSPSRSRPIAGCSAGSLPTEYLQAHLCGVPCDRSMPPQWYDVVLTTVYYSHFFAALGVGAFLWKRNRPEWVRYMRRYLTMISLSRRLLHGLPDGAAVDGGARRLPDRRHRPDHRPRLVRPQRRGQQQRHGAAERLGDRQPGRGDAVAALRRWRSSSPGGRSPGSRTGWRWLLLLYPLSMLFTLVYYAEHYVIDEIAGAAAGRGRDARLGVVGARVVPRR